MIKIKIFIFVFLVYVLVQNNDVTIAIIGTNDIHGTAFPASMIRADT